jgi:hypothetical protein
LREYPREFGVSGGFATDFGGSKQVIWNPLPTECYFETCPLAPKLELGVEFFNGELSLEES